MAVYSGYTDNAAHNLSFKEETVTWVGASAQPTTPGD